MLPSLGWKSRILSALRSVVVLLIVVCVYGVVSWHEGSVVRAERGGHRGAMPRGGEGAGVGEVGGGREGGGCTPWGGEGGEAVITYPQRERGDGSPLVPPKAVSSI